MATLNIDDSTKLLILKNSYSSLVSSFATMCYQLGIDPFAVDIDTFEVPAEDTTQLGGAMTRQVTALRAIIAEMESLNS